MRENVAHALAPAPPEKERKREQKRRWRSFFKIREEKKGIREVENQIKKGERGKKGEQNIFGLLSNFVRK